MEVQGRKKANSGKLIHRMLVGAGIGEARGRGIARRPGAWLLAGLRDREIDTKLGFRVLRSTRGVEPATKRTGASLKAPVRNIAAARNDPLRLYSRFDRGFAYRFPL